MICGFFGVVISLERAVAIGRPWAYLGSARCGLGGIAAIAGATAAAAWLFVAGSAVLLAATLDIFRRQTALFTFTLVAGSLAWVVGNALWATGSGTHGVVPWWLAFLILTIAGERLELSRFLPPSPVANATFAIDSRRRRNRTRRRGAPLGRADVRGEPARAFGLAPEAGHRAPHGAQPRASRASSRCACCRATRGSRSAVPSCWRPEASRPDRRPTMRRCTRWRWASCSRWCSVTRRSSCRRCCASRCRISPAFYVPLALLHLSLVVRLAGDATDRFDWTRVGRTAERDRARGVHRRNGYRRGARQSARRAKGAAT